MTIYFKIFNFKRLFLNSKEEKERIKGDWFNRNMLVFENRATSDQRTKFLFLSNLWTLAKTHTGEKMYSLVDFLTWFGSR